MHISFSFLYFQTLIEFHRFFVFELKANSQPIQTRPGSSLALYHVPHTWRGSLCSPSALPTRHYRRKDRGSKYYWLTSWKGASPVPSLGRVMRFPLSQFASPLDLHEWHLMRDRAAFGDVITGCEAFLQ